MPQDGERALTDDDVKAIVNELQSRFYGGLGRGLWGMAWKVIVYIIVGIALIGVGANTQWLSK